MTSAVTSACRQKSNATYRRGKAAGDENKRASGRSKKKKKAPIPSLVTDGAEELQGGVAPLYPGRGAEGSTLIVIRLNFPQIRITG